MTAAGPPPPSLYTPYGRAPRMAPRRPPLTNLPDPTALPEDLPPLPREIMLESRSVLTRRILRGFWRSAIVLLVLWGLLVLGYVWATGPTIWVMTPLLATMSDGALGMIASLLRYSLAGIGLALLVVPVLGTALSLAMVPVASRWAGRVDPRRLLRAADLPRVVASRVALCLILPPVAVVLALVVAVACQAPLHWGDLSYGALAGLGIGGVFIGCAHLILRRTVRGPALVVPEPLPGDLGGRALAPEQVAAQDRRHLPPAGIEASPRLLGRALLVTLRGTARWTGFALLGTMWLVFGLADFLIVMGRMADAVSRAEVGGDEMVYASTLPWSTYVLGGLVLLLVLGLFSVAPLLAVGLSRGARSQVTDQRTVDSWSRRREVNPWEARVCALVAWIDAVGVALAAIALGIVLGVLGELGALGWIWVLFVVLVLAPLVLGGAHSAMREGLRDVLYGPEGRYMRRRTRWARLVPELGTRTQLAADPVIAARIRREEPPTDGGATPEGLPAHVVEAPPMAPPNTPDGALPDFGTRSGPDDARHGARAPRSRTIPRDVSDLDGR